MFDLIFNKRFLIYASLIVAVVVTGTVIYQLYFVDTEERSINEAVLKSQMVKYQSTLADTICVVRRDRGFDKYIFCGYEKGCYFGHSTDKVSKESSQRIKSFIQPGRTVIWKRANDAIVHFINGIDTLRVVYEQSEENHVLRNGIIKTN